MMKWRISLILLGIIIFTPIIALKFLGFSIADMKGLAGFVDESLQASRAAARGEAYTPVALPDSLKDKIREALIPVILEGLGDTVEQKVSSATTLNDTRVVQYQVNIGIEDVLLQAEAPPGPELAELYMIARAPHYMVRFCDEVLVSLGTQCRVIRTAVSPTRDGRYHVLADLAYMPDYPFALPEAALDPLNGDVMAFSPLAGALGVKDDNAKLFRIHVTPPAMAANGSALENSAVVRLAYLDFAKSVCEVMRATYESCVVGRVDLSTRASPDTTLEVRYLFWVYAPLPKEEAVKTMLYQLVAQGPDP